MIAPELRKLLARFIMGQEEAIEAVVRAVIVADLGICDPHRPLGTFLFVGPTGVGKSQIGRSLAKILHDDDQQVVAINCTEFKNPHDVAKLVGAPPGYIGHEQPPFLTPEKLMKKFTVIIFEELEKADRNLQDLLLQVLERGELKTGRGVDLNFTNCFIIMTSNLGTREADKMRRGSLGFGAPRVIIPEDLAGEETKARDVYMRAVEDYFSPEFINRVDEIVIFSRLRSPQLMAILDKFLLDTRARLAMIGCGSIITDKAKNFLINVGTNLRYGARPLKRAVREHLEFPLANFIAERGLDQNQVAVVDYSSIEKKLTFEIMGTAAAQKMVA
ncbi:MAG: AAA family ATPase [bacterium]|nr:AAA family ATPase [bacterium]